jgi:ketosteroid isomerase-like protein
MSENLDLVRSIFADWERGDYRSAEWADPEIEFVIADGPAPDIWKGLAGMAKGFRETLNAWEDLRDVVEEYREIDQERVLVPVRLTGRGRTSGLDLADIASRAAYLFHIGDGKVTKIVIYMDRDRMFAHLGLKE